jgi:hypothetical protein
VTLPQVIQDALGRVQIIADTESEWADIAIEDWQTIRAELHRLTAIAEGVDPLVIRLHDVTAQLERADALLRGIAGCQWFNREAPATVELIDQHLQGAGDEV